LKYWLIGCGALAIIGIVVMVIVGSFVVGEIKDFVSEGEGVIVAYRELQQDFPFVKPEDGIFTPERYGQYIACRSATKEEARRHMEQLEDDDRSMKENLTFVLDLIPAVGQIHLATLRAAEMSPDEYDWYSQATLLALRYGEHPDAPEELKTLRLRLASNWDDNQHSIVKTEEYSMKSSSFSFDQENQIDEFSDLLPQVDPLFIRLPEQIISAVVNHAEEIENSVDLFVFDATFAQSLRRIEMEMRSGE